jgi:PAS domain S-box-containing protein
MTATDQAPRGLPLEPQARELSPIESGAPAVPEREAMRGRGEESLRRAQQATRTATFEWHSESGVEVWTPELRALYGLGSGDLGAARGGWTEWVHPDDHAVALAAVERALAGNEGTEAEWRVIWPDGSVHWLLGRFCRAPQAAGEPPGVLAVHIDITERKHREQALEKLVRERTMQLILSNRELDAFTYSVAHDLRAPLRGMNGFSKILLDEYSDSLNDDARDCLRRIQGNALLMGELIDGLLSLARVTRSALELQSVDLTSLARAAAAELATEEPERAVQLVIPEGLRAYADRALVSLLLQALLGNAWKFTSKVASARVEVGCAEQQGELVYFVRDNGVGFNMEYAKKLFVPFQRLHAPREFTGTGIGLAACYRIVGRHGGRIWAEGKEGEGAVFFFTLPDPDRPLATAEKRQV